LTTVRRATVRWPLSFREVSDSRRRSHASENSGRSIAMRLSLLGASTLTYSCVMGRRLAIADGCCPLVTKNVDMLRLCKSARSSSIRGYMIGSPTRLRAQCRTVSASFHRSIWTPGIPFVSLIICTCVCTAWSTM
jgi:hypothetical protein